MDYDAFSAADIRYTISGFKFASEHGTIKAIPLNMIANCWRRLVFRKMGEIAA